MNRGSRNRRNATHRVRVEATVVGYIFEGTEAECEDMAAQVIGKPFKPVDLNVLCDMTVSAVVVEETK